MENQERYREHHLNVNKIEHNYNKPNYEVINRTCVHTPQIKPGSLKHNKCREKKGNRL